MFFSDNVSDVSELGFYSGLARAIEGGPGQAMPDQWRAFLKGLPAKGVKADEIEWSGVNEWLGLQTGKVSKAAVGEYLKANGVQVTETVLEVVAAVAMTGKQYSAKSNPSQSLLAELKGKYAELEQQFRAATGRSFADLTESEARYIAKHPAPDAVRGRIAQAALQAAERGDGQDSGQLGQPRSGNDRSEPKYAFNLKSIRPARPKPPTRATESKWWNLSRDQLGRVQLGPGDRLYQAIARVATVVTDKLAMTPMSPELRRAVRSMNNELRASQNATAEVAEAMSILSLIHI